MEQTEAKKERTTFGKKYKKADELKRTNQLIIRVTDGELAELKTRIKLSGMKQSEFLRKSVFGKEITNTDGMKLVLPEMKRIGSNINQISAKLNSGGFIEPKDWKEAKEGFEKIWQQLRQSNNQERR